LSKAIVTWEAAKGSAMVFFENRVWLEMPVFAKNGLFTSRHYTKAQWRMHSKLSANLYLSPPFLTPP